MEHEFYGKGSLGKKKKKKRGQIYECSHGIQGSFS